MRLWVLSWVGLIILMIGAGACGRRYIYLECAPEDVCQPVDLDGGAGAGGTAPVLASALVAGTAFSCANVPNSLYCWGTTPAERDGTNANDPGALARATPVLDLTTAVAASAGGTLCAIESGHVACWGNNDTGQLGTTPTPTCEATTCVQQRSVVPGTDGAVGLAVSGSHGCAVKGDGSVVCWGANDSGQLAHAPGAGDQPCGSSNVTNCDPTATPVGVVGAVEVAVGADPAGAHGFGCARQQDGIVVCWGDNTKGQVSGAGFVNGAVTDGAPHLVPETIPGLKASALSAGGLSICAIDGSASAGGVFCWGDGGAGQGGPPSGVQMFGGGASGAAVPLFGVTSLAHGTLHTCAVSFGTVYCWGNNRSKQLGRDQASAFDAPCIVDGQGDYCSVAASPVAGFSDFMMVGAGGNHTCAQRAGGTVYCWGSNTFQESGHPLAAFGDLDPQRTPVMVQGLPVLQVPVTTPGPF